MYGDTWIWLVFPAIALGMMILCRVLFRTRRGGWSCCSPFGGRYSQEERFRKLEEEIQRLRGK